MRMQRIDIYLGESYKTNRTMSYKVTRRDEFDILVPFRNMYVAFWLFVSPIVFLRFTRNLVSSFYVINELTEL